MIKKLASQIKEYKKTAAVTPVLVLLEVVMEILIPLIMAELIDNGIDGGSMPQIIKYGIMLIVAAVLALIFGIAAGRTAAVASAGFAKNLRGAMYDHVQDFSFASIDKFSTASIVTRLTTDVTNVQMALSDVHKNSRQSAGNVDLCADSLFWNRRTAVSGVPRSAAYTGNRSVYFDKSRIPNIQQSLQDV